SWAHPFFVLPSRNETPSCLMLVRRSWTPPFFLPWPHWILFTPGARGAFGKCGG
ncbi:hypothetical protein KI387_013250, partial [Taxus chinensis]